MTLRERHRRVQQLALDLDAERFKLHRLILLPGYEGAYRLDPDEPDTWHAFVRHQGAEQWQHCGTFRGVDAIDEMAGQYAHGAIERGLEP